MPDDISSDDMPPDIPPCMLDVPDMLDMPDVLDMLDIAELDIEDMLDDVAGAVVELTAALDEVVPVEVPPQAARRAMPDAPRAATRARVLDMREGSFRKGQGSRRRLTNYRCIREKRREK